MRVQAVEQAVRRLTVVALAAAILASPLAHTPTPVSAERPSQDPPPVVDLSGVDWTGLARIAYGRCGEWHDLAIRVGWTEAQWPTLSRVIHRESRCNINSFNRTDPNGGSRGLMQINGYWCRKNKYNPSGWLQAQGILSTCDDLYNPETNLRAGLAMWNYSQQRNRCGWRPWATRC